MHHATAATAAAAELGTDSGDQISASSSASTAFTFAFSHHSTPHSTMSELSSSAASSTASEQDNIFSFGEAASAFQLVRAPAPMTNAEEGSRVPMTDEADVSRPSFSSLSLTANAEEQSDHNDDHCNDCSDDDEDEQLLVRSGYNCYSNFLL